MDLTQFIQKYGRQAFEELLDIVIIKNWKMNEGEWRYYCIKHGIIKQTTMIVTCNYYESQPAFSFTLRNGRGKKILSMTITSKNLKEFQSNQS